MRPCKRKEMQDSDPSETEISEMFTRIAMAGAASLGSLAVLGAMPGAEPLQDGPPPSSAYLALLPDGPEKRQFIVDCTGCHTWDAGVAFPNGAARDLESWRERVGSMHARFGRGSGFPIIADPTPDDSLASWLHRHFTRPPPNVPVLARDARETEYDIPAANDLPHDIIVAPDGSVVITGMFTGRMYVLDPVSGVITNEAIPVPAANPRAHHIDSDGTWWVVLGNPEMIARRTPAGRWTTHNVGMYAHSVARDASGVWVNGHFTGHPSVLAHVNAEPGEITRVELPSATRAGVSPIPYEIRSGPDGRIWMSELHGGGVLAYDPRDRSHQTFEMPVSHSGPRRLDVADDGVVWVPLYSAGEVVAFDPTTVRFTRYPLPDKDALPYVVRVDNARNAVWVATGASDAVYRLDRRTGIFETIRLPSRGALVRHIDIDAKTGDVWAAYGASPSRIPARVARIRAVRP